MKQGQQWITSIILENSIHLLCGIAESLAVAFHPFLKKAMRGILMFTSKPPLLLLITNFRAEAIEIDRENEQEVKRMEDGDMDNIGRY